MSEISAEVAVADEQEHAPGTVHEQLEGLVPELASQAEKFDAFEKAFDYRGDVTLTLRDGSVVEGYVFDRRVGGKFTGKESVRIMPKDGAATADVRYAEIARLVFSGKDTAAGKSFETWIKKYVEKKMKGERANIESEVL